MAEWTDKAACKQYPMSIFYPDSGQFGGLRAREICSTCPVKSECLDFAIETNQQHGIWGGMNANERRAFEDKRARINGSRG